VLARSYPLAPNAFTALSQSASSRYAPSLQLFLRDDGRSLTELGFTGAHDGILFGQGWSDAEVTGDEPARWASTESEIIISPADPRPLTLELGPGRQGQRVQVSVLDDAGTAVRQMELANRSLLTLDIPGDSHTKRRLVLRAESSGSPPNEHALRLFRYGWEEAAAFQDGPQFDATALRSLTEAEDIVPPESRAAVERGTIPADGLFVGRGWYPYEAYAGTTFRWLNTDGEIIITSPSRANGRLRLDLEPGPGLGGKPVSMDVIDARGQVVATIQAAKRDWVDVELPASVGPGPSVFHLSVTGGGQAANGDPRILNVRVFALRWLPGATIQSAAASPVATSAPAAQASPVVAAPPTAAGAALETPVAAAASPPPGEAPSEISVTGTRIDGQVPVLNGLFPDGWAAQQVSTELTQAADRTTLVVRGFVPRIDNPDFTTDLKVTVDGSQVASQTLKLGDVDIQVAVPGGPGRRRVELAFSATQQLPAGDGRQIGMRIRLLGFEPAAGPAAPPAGSAPGTQPAVTAVSTAPSAAVQALLTSTSSPDVTPAKDRQALERGELPADGLFVGDGWYPLETFRDRTFRWVANDAALIVTRPSGNAQALHLDVEPGPGLGLQPFTLQVRDEQGQTVGQVDVRGRETVTVTLPLTAGADRTFKLHVEGGGQPAPNDPRTLNFRVFAIELEHP
jgi:hypothetical protein